MKAVILVLAALLPFFTQAQTYTGTAATAPVELRAGLGTGKVLSTHPDTAACVAAAESAASKAATAKDSTATCRPAGGNVAIKYTPTPVSDPKPDVVWVQCALERQAGGCQFTGSREVRFGTSPTIVGRYAAKTVTGPVECTNVVFGDPVVGVEKKCWTTGTLTAPPVVTPPPTTPPVEPPPVTPPPTTPPSTVGGVPLRESFAGYPVVGPITATAGQVIERVRITTASGPCVIVAAPNVTIRDALIGPCGPGEAGKGIDGRSGLSSLVVQRTYFEDVSSALYVNGGQHPITFDRNVCTKIRGPMPRGQCVQFNNVKGSASSKITCNVADVQGQPNAFRNVEDWFNFYSTGQVEVAYNRIRGGGYQGYNGNNPSGTAILFGDAQGGTGLWAHDNVIVNVTNVGIGVAGSVGARVENNRIYMNGPASGNYTNIGIYVATYSQGACSGHRVAGNRAWVRKNDGSPNHYWTSGSCGPVDTGGTANPNVWDDASLDPVAMFNAVPTQCQ
ncbi:hypothetical protein [Methylibium sp.]|uniref:hypothetical protein n=1 Tax=Methylibium sp. TaxID=2067992 RepID=UPI003D0DC798